MMIHIVFSFLATIAFALLLNVPKKAWLACGVSGVVGWLVYYLSFEISQNLLIAYFLSAFLMGITSLIFARIKKMPVTVFNIPALVPLVPGGDAYRAVRYLFIQDFDLTGHHLMRIIIIVSAIAFGFMMTSIVEQMMRSFFNKNKGYREEK